MILIEYGLRRTHSHTQAWGESIKSPVFRMCALTYIKDIGKLDGLLCLSMIEYINSVILSDIKVYLVSSFSLSRPLDVVVAVVVITTMTSYALCSILYEWRWRQLVIS